MGETVRRIPSRCHRACDVRTLNKGTYKLKKLEEPSGEESDEGVTIETIIMAGIERGLSFESIQKMTIGQVVDFCIEYNNRNKDEETIAKKKRKATRADVRDFFGV